MLRAIRPAYGLRYGLCALAAVIALTAIGTDPADARGRRKRIKVAPYSPPYAAVVVDANSGNILHGTNPDALRHPASLTKIMTLYLLFEQIESGKMKLDTQMEVSDHASQQAPSKLGLTPGQTISVENAIHALVTKSANDVAAVIAEAISGDEDAFARLMTRKARALGMNRTVYTNASGLPDEDQLTTARDQALLGRAIQDRFPRQYRYFATPSFVYQGRAIRNHNRLLGRVEGVDGIKTGYTRASGFNLVSSLRRGNRHVVAVVLGGASGSSRDARMRLLLEQHLASAATHRTVAKIIESGETAVAAKAVESVKVAAEQPKAAVEQRLTLARADAMAPVTVASTPAETAEAAAPAQTPALQAAPVLARAPKPGSGDPINPVKVKTITVKAGNVQTAMLVPLVSHTPQASVAPANFATNTPTVVAAPLPAPTGALPPPPGARPGVLGVLPAAPPSGGFQMAGNSAPVTTESVAPRGAHPRGPWIIQVGAFPKETEAKERLREAQSLAKKLVDKADPFTERVVKGNQELYRARFAGFNQDAAEAACKHLKRNDIACLAMKN